MIKRIQRFMLKPVKKFLREEIDFYTACINESKKLGEATHCDALKLDQEKFIDSYMDKRSEALHILDWICRKY